MLHQLHIPKTGGLALAHGLDGHIHRFGHGTTLRAIPDPAVTIVRDPIARFVSAWDMCARQGKHFKVEYSRWPTASLAAVSEEAMAWLAEKYLHAFYPLTWWLESADYARSRLWYIAHTETLDADFAVICERLGLEGLHLPAIGDQHRNDHAQHGSSKSVLDADAAIALREYYDDDYRLLEELDA